MHKALVNLRRLAFILVVLIVIGLGADYLVDKSNFPGVYTLFPLSLLIITLLVMLVMWIFRTMTQKDR